MAIDRPPINRHPIGLLELFGIKTGGRYPEQLGTGVQPTIDLLYWYAQTNSIFATFGQVALGPGAIDADSVFVPWVTVTPASVPVTVPGSEYWLVTEACVRWTFNSIAGGELGGMELASTNTTPALSHRIWPCHPWSGGEFAFASDALYGRGGAVSLARPILLTPGETLGFYHGGLELGAGGNLFANGTMSVLRLR